jgi:hypothetical protein
MQAAIKTQASSASCSGRLIEGRGFQYTRFLYWRAIRRSLSRIRQYLQGTMQILFRSLGSLHGHIGIQSPTEFWIGVNLGQEFLSQSDKRPRLNPRTTARAEYRQMLRAIYPWIDSVDLRIFLMGFDAGEEWVCDSMGSSEERRPSENESWLDLATQAYGYVPDRVRQRIKKFDDQTSDGTPVAISGVTSKPE